MARGSFHLKRVYEAPEASDGVRVLVDRVWPRGLTKEAAKLDHWMKELAPSTALRKWFGHDPAKWDGFRERYFRELDKQSEGVARLRAMARGKRVTLLFGAKDEEHNQAVALAEYLKKRRGG